MVAIIFISCSNQTCIILLNILLRCKSKIKELTVAAIQTHTLLPFRADRQQPFTRDTPLFIPWQLQETILPLQLLEKFSSVYVSTFNYLPIKNLDQMPNHPSNSVLFSGGFIVRSKIRDHYYRGRVCLQNGIYGVWAQENCWNFGESWQTL